MSRQMPTSGPTASRIAAICATDCLTMSRDARRILADQAMTEVLHQTDQAARDPVRPELAVAGESRVGADRAEVPRARRRETVGHDERLDPGDLHVCSFIIAPRLQSSRGLNPLTETYGSGHGRSHPCSYAACRVQ